jgi:hypothetical protein
VSHIPSNEGEAVSSILLYNFYMDDSRPSTTWRLHYLRHQPGGTEEREVLVGSRDEERRLGGAHHMTDARRHIKSGCVPQQGPFLFPSYF